jgi:hypothetical protein
VKQTYDHGYSKMSALILGWRFHFPVTLGQASCPWKKVIQVRRILILTVLRDLFQQQVNILIRFQAVCFGGFCYAVQDCTCLRSADGVNRAPRKNTGYTGVLLQRDLH